MAHTKTAPSRSRVLKSFNPRTGEVVGEIPTTSLDEVSEVVAVARKVAPDWASIPVQGRARMMRAVRYRINTRLEDLVETIARETGKPRTEALTHDVLPAVLVLLYYEKTAARHLRSRRIGGILGPALGMASKVEWRPYGVIGTMTPWNYPFFISVLTAAPALIAGNTVVVKPSEVTPGVGELLRDVLEPLPPGVATVIQGAGEVGAALVGAPVDKICFVGSPETGRKVAAAAADHLTPMVMELGGKDSAIVLEDADLDAAASGIVWGAFANAGQTCAGLERVYVVDEVADEFVGIVTDKVAKLRQGSEECDVGPLSFSPQLGVVEGHVIDAIEKGAKVVAGGPGSGPGNEGGSLWYAPTVLENVNPNMHLMQEETFGPTLPIIRIRDENEAVERASKDAFSLTSSVWTSDARRAERLASRIRTGAVGINDPGMTASGAPWAPWGGVGESGYGRLNGRFGLMEFVYPVHVSRNLLPAIKRPWYYPYDDATTATFDAAVRVLASPSIGDKVKAVSEFMGAVGPAIRSKL